MEKYLGVKMVVAEPAKGYSGKLYTSASPAGVKTDDGYKVTYEDGYVSWYLKEVFEKAYRPINGLTFGLAIEALKQGNECERNSWGNRRIKLMTKENISMMTEKQYSNIELPWIGMSMKSSLIDLSMWEPYIPSQTDMLAEDWMIIE